MRKTKKKRRASPEQGLPDKNISEFLYYGGIISKEDKKKRLKQTIIKIPG